MLCVALHARRLTERRSGLEEMVGRAPCTEHSFRQTKAPWTTGRRDPMRTPGPHRPGRDAAEEQGSTLIARQTGGGAQAGYDIRMVARHEGSQHDPRQTDDTADRIESATISQHDRSDVMLRRAGTNPRLPEHQSHPPTNEGAQQ